MATPFSNWLKGPLGTPVVALGAEIGYSSKDTGPHSGEDRQSRGRLCRLPVFAMRHPTAVRRQQRTGGASAQGDPVKPRRPRFLLGAGHMAPSAWHQPQVLLPGGKLVWCSPYTMVCMGTVTCPSQLTVSWGQIPRHWPQGAALPLCCTDHCNVSC